MAQTVVWSANLGTTTRRVRSTGATSGQGQSRRWYVGKTVNYDYDAYVKFNPVWTGVGKIVSAVMTIYTGDGLGETPSTQTESPNAYLRRLTSAFTEGNAPNGTWQADDWTSPAKTASDGRTIAITRATETVNNIDITAFVEDWAPKTVKRRNGSAGGAATNYGIALLGTNSSTDNIDFLSDKWTDASKRPFVTLTYDYGPTAPDAPTNLTPTGAQATFEQFEGDFSDIDPTDRLKSSSVQVYDTEHTFSTIGTSDTVSQAAHGLVNGDIIYFTRLVGGTGLTLFQKYYVVQKAATTFKVSLTPGGTPVDVTEQYTDGGWSKLLYAVNRAASNVEVVNGRFEHVPDGLNLVAGRTYRWRAAVFDNEGSVSTYPTSLVSFSVTNNAPDAPTLTPATSSSFATLDGVLFRATFTDDDVDDYLASFQYQLSAYPEGDARWMDDEFILWNTGRRFVSQGDPAEAIYGGQGLAAGTYYWRGRVWDNRAGVSDWTYATIIVTEAFEEDPEAGNQTVIQLRPRAPWRIVIKAMGALRGPGATVAVIEDAQNVGASELYNSPGELHFTIPIDHPQIAVIEPKQTHYSVQFRDGDGWREKFAGLMWDFDATETGVIMYGIDYLAILDMVADERYDASNPEKPAEKGGSKYVTTGKNSIRYIVIDQLTKEKAIPNSPLGFVTLGTVETMNETLVVYSTYSPRLTFIAGLLDSHRAGSGKRTRIRCRRTSAGGYEWVVQDNPGVARDNLRLKYGELVQGYRVVAFGTDWASRVSAIGRAKDGIAVLYKTASASSISEATWGRFNYTTFIDGVSDANDLARRAKQLAVAGGKLGKQVGLGIRTGWLQPKDGYDLCDTFPIDIEHGSVSTTAFGSGYWNVVGITWETAAQNGKQTTTLTFQPREDTETPDTDLLTLQEISPQAEWQVGYTAPPITASSKYWLDQTTGIVYERVAGELLAEGITGSA